MNVSEDESKSPEEKQQFIEQAQYYLQANSLPNNRMQ
jgi:hypothetical protein